MNFSLNIWLVLLCLALLSGCSNDKKQPQTGKQLFEYYCAGCHGESAAGQFLRGIPPLVKNKALRPVPLKPSEIRHKIEKNTDPNSKMPSFDNLSNQQANLIAHYIQSLSR